jgi:hypothetical protein
MSLLQSAASFSEARLKEASQVFAIVFEAGRKDCACNKN